jgi:nitroimidazol reductase NimA-like FMN-containing flavoprotein (pyridoxamine 5'-phosphate oxidase superfamily)
MADGLEYDGEGGETLAGASPDAPARPPSDRTRVRRLPTRGRYDRASLDAILDAGVIAHVGWTGDDGQPYATPTIAWRVADRLYWHGSSASRMLRATDGRPVCVTVTLLDGYVLARSGFNHSVNFRSAMVLGTAHLATDPAEVDATLEAFIEGLYPGRWAQLRPMSPQERKATTVLWMDLTEASAKIRAEENHDDGDEAWPAWGGVIPLSVVAGQPEPDPLVADGTPAPAFRLPGVGRGEGSQG